MADEKVTDIGCGKKPKAKQSEIPGTERPRVPEIDEIAEKYAAVRDEWQKLGEELTTLKDQLHRAMNRHDVKLYPLDHDVLDDVVIVPGEEDVKVRAKKGRRKKAVGDDD